MSTLLLATQQPHLVDPVVKGPAAAAAAAVSCAGRQIPHGQEQCHQAVSRNISINA